MNEIIGISLFLGLLTVKFIYLIDSAQAFFSGSSIDERKAAYISNQGKKWESSFPAAMKQGVYAWLDRLDIPYTWNGKSKSQLISEEIGYITGTDNCLARGSGFFWPWKNCWWAGDEPGPIVGGRIFYQYYQNQKSIADADAEKIKNRLRGNATSPGVWCAVANYHFRYLVTAYLYTARIENVGQVVFPQPSNDQYACPQPFTYNGRSYRGGNSYDSAQIYKDYLNYKIDEWLRNGTAEDITTGDYYYAQIHAIALLADFAPDQALKNKAKMFLDWLIFNYSVSFSAHHPAGGHGRNYTAFEEQGKDFFPWGIFFNLDQSTIDTLTQQGVYTDLYVSKYRHPALLTDIFQSLNGQNKSAGDDYYRIIRGSISAFGKPFWEQILPSGYRYDYITLSYNLGGAGNGTGWELNVASSGTPLKLWMNHCSIANERGCNTEADLGGSGDGGGELFFLGTNGYQYRNALFMNGGGKLHQFVGNNTWDERSTEGNWQFFREGKVGIAATISQNGPGAVEVATIGVDYPTYDTFKAAIKSNTSLSSGGFRTSKGFTITPGYVDYGSDFSRLPFDRLEVWEGHVGRNDERKIVNWNNNVMSISWRGRSCVYDFNSWSQSGECGSSGGPTNTPTPTNKPTATHTPAPGIPGDLDKDGDVDIFDYNILIENFGTTSCGNVADIDGNCKVDIFDYNTLVENFGKKA